MSGKKVLKVFPYIVFTLILLELGLQLEEYLHKEYQDPLNTPLHKSGMENDTKTILVLGDSFSFGDDSWPTFLQQYLDEHSVSGKFSVINAAVRGATSSDVVKQAPAILKKTKPEMVLVMMGISDEEAVAENSSLFYLSLLSLPLPRLRTVQLVQDFADIAWYHLRKPFQGTFGVEPSQSFFSLFSSDEKKDQTKIRAAREARQQGNLLQAERYLLQAIEQNATSWNAAYELLLTYLQGNATSLAENILLVPPSVNRTDQAQALLWEAEMWRQAGNFREAEAAAKKASLWLPNQIQPHYKLIHIYVQEEMLGEAEEIAHLLAQRWPEVPEVHAWLGEIYYLQKRYPLAIETFLTIREEQRTATTELLLGKSYRKLNQFEAAAATFQEAIYKGDNSEYYLPLADTYWQDLHDPSAALQVYDKALLIYPQLKEARLKRGRLFQQQGKFTEAETDFKEVLRSDQKDLDSLLLLGKLYSERGEKEKAAKAFHKAVLLYPENPEALAALGEYFIRFQREKLPKLLLLLDHKPTELQAQVYSQLGNSYLHERNWTAAEEMFARARAVRGTRNRLTQENFLTLQSMIKQEGAQLVIIQYPLLPVEDIKKYFTKIDSPLFVDNEALFLEFLQKEGYPALFSDDKFGRFGHGTSRTNQILAENVGTVILSIPSAFPVQETSPAQSIHK